MPRPRARGWRWRRRGGPLWDEPEGSARGTGGRKLEARGDRQEPLLPTCRQASKAESSAARQRMERSRRCEATDRLTARDFTKRGSAGLLDIVVECAKPAITILGDRSISFPRGKVTVKVDPHRTGLHEPARPISHDATAPVARARARPRSTGTLCCVFHT